MANALKLPYTFKTPGLLDKALTHPSFRRTKVNDFERLEFLGDRVLGLVVAELLYTAFPKEKEGDLAKRSAALVNREVCCDVAQELGLEQYLKVIGTELSQRTAVLGDAMEALIGAVYLDAGMDAAKNFVSPLWKKRLAKSEPPPKDNKSRLQEWSQGDGLGIPVYTMLSATGPAHAPEFVIEVTVAHYSMKAQGQTRKVAEQEAARLLLEHVGASRSSKK